MRYLITHPNGFAAYKAVMFHGSKLHLIESHTPDGRFTICGHEYHKALVRRSVAEEHMCKRCLKRARLMTKTYKITELKGDLT